MRDGFVKVAARTPEVRVADVSFNVEHCVDAACDAEEAVTGVRHNPWDSSAKPHFAPWDFKRHGGYDCSVKRAMELGLYRQSYCGCEFSRR